jgi:hypothetical protein
MGTNDIDIDVDADNPDLDDYILTGTAAASQTDANGGYIQWVNASGMYHINFVRDVQSGGWKMWCTVTTVTNQSLDNQGGSGCFCKVGNYWFTIWANVNGTKINTATITWRKEQSRPPTAIGDTGADNEVSEQTVFTSPAVGHKLIGLHFKNNGNVDVLYNTDSNVIGADVTTWTGDKISEFGFFSRMGSSGSRSCSVGDLFLSADIGTALGGTITDPGFNEIVVQSFINTLGQGEGKVSEYNLSNMSTHIANIGKYIQVFMPNGNIAFQGELRRLSMLNKDHINYLFRHNAKKFNNLDCSHNNTNANPVVYAGIVRNLDFNDSSNVNIINDNNASFDNYSSKIAVFKLTDPQKKTYHPEWGVTIYREEVLTSDDPGGPDPGSIVVPDDTDGLTANLYFMDPDEPTDNSDLVASTANQWAAQLNPTLTTKKSLCMISTIQVFLDSASSFDNMTKITFNMVVSFRELSHYFQPGTTSNPRIVWFNNSSGEFDSIRKIETNDAGGLYKQKDNDDIFGEDETPDIHLSIQITNMTDIDDYFLQVEDNGTTIQYKVLLGVRGGIASSAQILGEHTVHVRKCEMVIEFDTDESESQGHFPVGTQIGTTDIPLTTNATLTLTPSQAGYSAGDTYSITPTVKTFIETLYASLKADAGLLWDLDLDVSGTEIYGITTNFNDKYFVFLLQQVTGDYNGSWWIDEDVSLLKIKSIDNLVTLTETITFADALDGKIFFDIDGATLADLAKVVGKTSTVTKSVAATNLSLGEETIIENDPSLIDVGAVTGRVDSLVSRAGLVLNGFSIVLDMEITALSPSNYSDIKKGVLVPCKFPSASSPYISDTLYCIGVEYHKGKSTGHKGILMAHFRKRLE